jgi:serine/threonine-protein kinase
MSYEALGASLADRYRIERELGQGGMATVYLAEDLKHKRRVALKVLKPELAAVLGAERFVQEITTTAALQHPHILPLFDSGTADGFLFYVMPFIDGETLRSKLDRDTQLGIDEAVKITTAVADALDYAHRHGVIHRDIKPENILLHEGRPMVADFGIALAVSAAAGGRMTETGLSLGTPHYMSPEQATAEKEISARSDVYSLASVLYEMLAGQPPHLGGSAQQIIMKIIAEPVEPVTRYRKAVPPHVAAAVAMALEKLPADRFESAAAFAAALTNPALSSAATARYAAAHGTPSAGRRLLPWAGGAALGLVAASLGFLLLRSGEPPPDVVRFPFSLPTSQPLAVQGDEDAPFAISPDGSRIVYAAQDSGSAMMQLFIRRLDQLEGTPLQGTEDAIAPFFSPDGLWVGFATEEDEKLRKVPVNGGPPITLAEDVVDQFASGSWGDDGHIVYTNANYMLARVPGTGGVPEELVNPDSAGNIAMFWPSVLPGSRAVLFNRCGNTCGETDLALLDLATREITVVIPGASRGWYIDTGHLVYATPSGAVYAVAFDLKARTVTGSPVPVLDQVQAGRANGSRLAISRSGAMMYLPGTAVQGVQLVELDRTGRESILSAERGQFAHPRWSPTRDQVALTISTGDGGSQIWTYDVGSKTLSQLTREGSNYRPSWSPDGRMVAFFSTATANPDLYWIPADGSGPPERVADGEDTINGGTTFWTRDGKWIVFDGLPDSTAQQEDILAVGTGADRTRKAVVATSAQEETGAVSPDGRWIAHGSNEGGRWQVYVRPFMAPGGRWLISTGEAATPLWASNDELVYIDFASRSLMAARLEFTPTVRVVSRTPLFNWDPYIFEGQSSPAYDVSRDGQRFLALKSPRATRGTVAPIVVLHWFEDVKQRMAAQGGRQP